MRMDCNFWHTCRYKVKQQRQEQRHTRTETLCYNAPSIIKAIIFRRLFECVAGETELLGEKRRNTGTEHTALVHAIGFGSLLRDNIHTRPLYKLATRRCLPYEYSRSERLRKSFNFRPKKLFVKKVDRQSLYYRKIMIQVASVHLILTRRAFQTALREILKLLVLK
uniref:Uncharacterized protein n=1 Tax=Trichogramma kaykai TaxID=54128 RepID=A0ABD2WP53_9HYME